MAEVNRLPGDKLTVGAQICANSAIKNLSCDVPGRLSGSGGTESNFRADRAVGGHQIMASSNLPGVDNAETLKAQGRGDPAMRDESYPSSLRSSSTCTSYSLEISLSANSSNSKDSQPLPLQTPPGSRDNQVIWTNPHNPLAPHSGERNASVTRSYKPSASKPLEKRDQPTDSTSAHFNQCLDMFGNCQIVTSKSTSQEHSLEKSFSSFPRSTAKVGAHPVSPELNTELMDGFSKEKTLTGEEALFYAFVILHAPEDTDEAVRIKARLEAISSTTGATFSEEFAEPGRSVFRCMQDAIDNSAFSMLLLTQNFNTRLNETNVDSALMNSVEKVHKYNTVIPLLPQTNALTHDKLPLVLKTKISLDERKSKNFETMAKKVLNSKKIQTQKEKWRQELHVKKQQEYQQRLREENRHCRDLNREHRKVQELEQERMNLLRQKRCSPGPYYPQPFSDQGYFRGAQPHGPGPYQRPCTIPSYASEPSSNIHIENAKYIIIGNDAKMTMGGAGNTSGEEDM
ncbi:TIR domain-containing adapter molecule 1 [Electrophorus electricus]|uniref:TIR domain containing adaptor molecule 1 n=1 Tax=Electrophorus electricus TaxID=8005 RepID=A0A4W4EKX0_ELEEL|nr:TIR domain-containing adapter molecule 1 [Electrophorus electricus]XP_026888705.2 TIR domain-containing adapter molecule 1 [Electrophorus electricus]